MSRMSIVPVTLLGDEEDEELMELGRWPRRRRRGGRRGGRRGPPAFMRRRRQQEEEGEEGGGGGFGGVRRNPPPSWFSGDNYFGDEADDTGAFKWPSWLRKKKKPAATAAGPNMTVVTRPGSELQAGVITLKPGLYLVGEVPKTAASPEFGFLPFLVPMMVRTAKRALADNNVEQDGKPARGLSLFRSRDRDDDPERTTALARRSHAAESPRWFDAHEAHEVGFGWMED